MARQQIKAIVFDVMGTMCDMTPLEARIEAKGFSKAEAQASDPALASSTQAITDGCRL